MAFCTKIKGAAFHSELQLNSVVPDICILSAEATFTSNPVKISRKKSLLETGI